MEAIPVALADGQSESANAAHKVFDTWSEPRTQLGSEGNHAQHMFDTIPNPQGRVLHVVVHQYQQLVSPDLLSQVFSAYGTVEEMFHSPHQDSPTHTSSIFIEYAHASMANDALHGLHGLYLYQDDCQLEIRHANSCELQVFYGYSAPSFSQEQLELLQQIKKDLQALSQNGTFGLVDVCLGTDLEATPPTRKTLSADISSTFEIESSYTEENQEGLDIKEHEKQLHWGLESLVLPTIALPDVCTENEEANLDNLAPVLPQWPTEHQQPQDSSSATIADLTVDFPRLHEQYVQADAEVEHLIKIDVLHRSQPWPLPMEDVINQNSSDAPMLTPTIVITVKEVVEESSDSQTAHINCRIIHPATPPNICKSSPFIQSGHLWNFCFGLVDSNLQPYALVKCVRQPWDPGKMDVLESVDYQWNYSGINTRMSQHKLFAQNELLHRVSLALNSCCFVLSWNTTLEASNFKINEAQLLAPTSALHKLLSHVGDNTQLQSVTWKIRELDIYLWVPTSTTPIVHLLCHGTLAKQKLSAPKQVMVRKNFAAFMADQFDTHDIHQLNLKCGKSWFMANTHKPSRIPATIFQKLQTNSVGYMLIYDCSNINSMILTVRSYFYTNSEMNLLLDISSLKECHTVSLVVWKIKFNWPPEFIAIFSRTNRFDGLFQIIPVEIVLSQYKPLAFWLNVQHDSFYNQFNLSMRSYILSMSKQYKVDYISSPEVSFLKSILGRVGSKTKLVFRFLDEGLVEPSMNQTYGSLLKILSSIKTFASGILVPKHYIWPVTADNYLQPYTSVVDDAHKAGLEIYAADFANDFALSYNYSYDPLAEYLGFIDNGAFGVDGLLTDFPITPLEAIGCFSNLNNTKADHGAPLVISHNGASGDYPDCTDLAYQKAVADGADVIDCAVQVTKDGIPICMGSIDLMDVTNVATSQFSSQAGVINDIKAVAGVYTFNLTWDDISTNLKPMISNPWGKSSLSRNPRSRNAGNFMRLSDFLAFAKGKDLSGIMITVERAAFMAEKLGFGVVDAVMKALDDSGYNKQAAQKVMIQSTNSSTLVKLKQEAKYNLVYKIDEDVKDAAPSSLADIKKFADAVSVSTQSVYPATSNFLINQTNPLVKSLQSAGLPVYVYLLMNEFISQPYDFFSDATAQINALVHKGGEGGGVDGLITDFPGTAHRYKLNSCKKKMGDDTPYYMLPPQRGGLLGLLDKAAMPPTMAPMPVLTDSDVAEPPLPPVSNTTAPAPSQATARTRTINDVSILAALLVLCASLLI